MSSAVLCKTCNNQRFRNAAALEQHVRDSAAHRVRVRQQVVCAVCPGAKTFKDAAAYNNHAAQNREHRTRAAAGIDAAALGVVPAGALTPSASGASFSGASFSGTSFSGTSVSASGTSTPSGGLPDVFSRGASRPESAASVATVQSPPVSRPTSFMSFAPPRVTPVASLRNELPPALSRLRRASTASSSFSKEPVVDVPPTRPQCTMCGDYLGDGGIYQHSFEKHPDVCCGKCFIVLRSPTLLQQHFKDSDVHPKCEYCPTAFADSDAHFEHVEQVHSQVHAHKHDSLYEVANAHIVAPPLQESYSQVSSSDYSYRAPSPLSSCDLSDVPEQPDAVGVAAQAEPCETPKSDVPEFQRGLTIGIAQVTEQTRASSEPPLSAVAPRSPGFALDDFPDEPSVDLEPSTQSIISQASEGTPSTASDLLDLPQQTPPRVESRSSSLDARPRSNVGSAWSVVSSPKSTHSEAVEWQASPPAEAPSPEMSRAATPRIDIPRAETPHAETPCAETPCAETPRLVREAPIVREVPVFRAAHRRPTGGTVASEASSVVQTPVSPSPASPPGLLFTLTEQLVAQRVRQQAAQTEQAVGAQVLGSRGSSGRTTPMPAPGPVPRVRTPEPRARPESASGGRDAVQGVKPASKSRSTSRTMTSSSYDAAPASTAHNVAGAASGYDASGLQDAFPTPKPRLQWHCRICLRPPTDPTVTMCGHLFCHECIVIEMAKNLQCPVCRTAMLVRLNVAGSC
ncbi:hypothetical protein PsYK624_025520 [Phanerochaete sordida]|uniref:RING-type domain-containing protein n=1 Tax=Phanerochaete sordida TaxID=48140 RepID=A0A9P3LA70_9APHY|nr:hypothetical protein PsYK624_025520 [Phanerochaete sordida]